jgi:TonB family protein
MKKKCVTIAFVMMFLTGAILAQNNLQETETPKVIKAVAPDYPPIAKAAHIEGEWRVDATIDSTGTVAEIDIINPPKLKILREAVEKAAVRWKFEPSRNTLEKRKVQLTFIFRFVPEKEAAITFIPPYQVEVTGYKPTFEQTYSY